MSNTQHTPGPWLRDEAGRGTYMVFQAGSEGDGTLVCSNVKSEADARLIASAPAILAALQALMPMLEDTYQVGGVVHPYLAQARAAIVAATGGE